MSERVRLLIAMALVMGVIAGCVPAAPAPTDSPPPIEATATQRPPAGAPAAEPSGTPAIAAPLPTEGSGIEGLTEAEIATLSSLRQVSEYPLYTMTYYGDYGAETSATGAGGGLASADQPAPAWACSLFAALGDPDGMVYGRNFDWQYSPALLLFTNPPDGYASVSMVDIAYLGFTGARATTVDEVSLDERVELLSAYRLPFDGMNEQGVAVGMAAVPPGGMEPDPAKQTIDSLMVIRKILDQAANVDEAVAILLRYNIEWGGGPPLHYLLADRSGRAMLVEYYRGEMVVTPNEAGWHQATNFLRASARGPADGQCWRYDRINRQLADVEGQSGVQEAMELLDEVSQENTQWSVVYGMSSGEIEVVMGQAYDDPRGFHLVLDDASNRP